MSDGLPRHGSAIGTTLPTNSLDVCGTLSCKTSFSTFFPVQFDGEVVTHCVTVIYRTLTSMQKTNVETPKIFLPAVNTKVPPLNLNR